MQVVNVFLCRSAARSVFGMPFFGNPLILWGVALEIVLLVAVNHLPLANRMVGTLPVPNEVWLFLVPFALASIGLEEFRKVFVRRRHARSG
jgi:magnesium-transporting ATPase (P-type)